MPVILRNLKNSMSLVISQSITDIGYLKKSSLDSEHSDVEVEHIDSIYVGQLFTNVEQQNKDHSFSLPHMNIYFKFNNDH